MPEPNFFPQGPVLTLKEVADLAGVQVPEGADADRIVRGVAPIETAGPGDIAYMDNAAYAEALSQTRAGICLVSLRFAPRVPPSTIALVVPQPYRVFALVLARLFPSAMRPGSGFGATGVSPGSFIHPTARLEHGVTVDPGAVVGPHAEVGSGTVLGAHAVIGPDVKVGRDCSIGPNVTVLHALLGNRVILHPGVRIGQDGFGFAMSAKGHAKVAQIGRVIIQDDVEIGANTTVDRGASRDTIIGEGTKIDNLVQVGHNVVIGRHCIIVAQTGMAGSTTLEDFVVLSAHVGTSGHLTIGTGAQIAAKSFVYNDVPPGARWGGIRAKPLRDWLRELAALKTLASDRDIAKQDDAPPRE